MTKQVKKRREIPTFRAETFHHIENKTLNTIPLSTQVFHKEQDHWEPWKKTELPFSSSDQAMSHLLQTFSKTKKTVGFNVYINKL